jgi:hypothetical protein
MHKNATKCNETLSKWCKNKHGASKIIDIFETYHRAPKDPPRPSTAEAGHPHAPDSEMEEGQAALRDVGAGGNLRRPDGLKRGPPPTPRPRVTRSTSASMAGQDPATGKVK